jgi:hypothetical protein
LPGRSGRGAVIDPADIERRRTHTTRRSGRGSRRPDSGGLRRGQGRQVPGRVVAGL